MKKVEATNFIEQIINEDIEAGRVKEIQTRFPPEPNGYLHIGHIKSMLVNFGTAEKYGGKCNLFFDDTNPSKEKTEFVDAIRRDIEWMGYHWAKEVYASDFFDEIYGYAEKLIEDGKAFVCDLSPEEISATRGTLTEAGTESPYRNRSVEENLRLFREMKAGKYADGEKCLRAKIDMSSPNMNLRDPVIYRILRATHHRTGDKWCIYPMYDYAHPICDYLQGVTHSLCTLEFEDHRPLYDWVGINLGFSPKPRQIEFARLAVTNTVMSKRYLKKLVEEGHVHGWDDPRMPTIAGLRNRGVPPEALLDFAANRDRQGEFGMSALVSRSVYPRRSQRERGTHHGGFGALEGDDFQLRGHGGAGNAPAPIEARTGNAESDVRKDGIYRQGGLFLRSPAQVSKAQTERIRPPEKRLYRSL